MSQKEERAWYEDPAIKNLYVKAQSNAFRGYTAVINTPRTTFTGTSALTQFIMHLGAYLAPEEKRVLIVVDKDLRRYGEKVAKEMKRLRDIDSRIFDNVLPEVPKFTVMEGVKMCQEYDPKVIIGVGGGSAIDTAKLILILYEKPDINFNTMMAPSYLGLRKKVWILAAIPTTSGTGSESGWNAVISDTDRHPPKKTSIPLYELVPDFAILITEFVKSMPPFLTMGSGMDAFTHSMGAYVLTGSNEFTDMHNLKAIEMILKYLPRTVKNGNDLEARQKMQMAAYISGIGFINVSAGIDHSLGHSFGGIFHVHHGVAVALFVCASIAYQAKLTNRVLDIAKLFKVKRKGKKKDQILRELLEEIQKFQKKSQCPISIKDLEKPKISKEDYYSKMDILEKYAYLDYPTLSSTRKLDPPQIRMIFEIAYENKIDNLMELYYM